MLQDSDLKTWLHKKLSQEDKLLLLLVTFDAPAQIKDLKAKAKSAGLHIPKTWNPSRTLGRSDGRAIRTGDGWEITEAGREHLRSIGVAAASPVVTQVAGDLRAEMAKISDNGTRAFVEEAVKCFEAGLLRSAIVMSWLAAVDVLHKEVHANHLAVFNAEASRVSSRWRAANTPDDLGKMKESDFLDRVAAIGVIDNNTKKALKVCLDRRNSCGHPNSFQIGKNVVGGHIEVLILNVFSRL